MNGVITSEFCPVDKGYGDSTFVLFLFIYVRGVDILIVHIIATLMLKLKICQVIFRVTGPFTGVTVSLSRAKATFYVVTRTLYHAMIFAYFILYISFFHLAGA